MAKKRPKIGVREATRIVKEHIDKRRKAHKSVQKNIANRHREAKP